MLKALQPSFAGGEIAPDLLARVDTAKWQVGVARALNVFVRPYGGLSTRPGLRFVAEVKDSTAPTRLIPFQFNTEQTYALEVGGGYIRFHRDTGQIVEGNQVIGSATAANPVAVSANGHGYANGDEVFISGVVGMTELNGRNFRVANATANSFTLKGVDGVNIDGTGYEAYVSGGSVARVYEIAAPYAAAEVFDIGYVQSNDVIYLCHPNHAVRKLSRTGDTAWTLTQVTFQPGIAAPVGVAAQATSGPGAGETYRYRVSAISDDTAEESLPSGTVTTTNDLTVADAENTVTWGAVTGASRYIVYKEENGVFGFIGGTEATSFVDDNIDPDTSDTPQKARNPFGAAGDYPAVAMIHQERLSFGQTRDRPQTIWFSSSANFENFNVSVPTKDDDAIEITLAARQVNEIRSMVSLEDLIIFTSGAEWRLNAPNDGVLTPSNRAARAQTYHGASKVPPVVIGNTVLFIQDKGSVVRDLAYSFESDGYRGNDLTIFAPHLFRNRMLLDWCYAQAPYKLVQAVRDDGALLTLAYLREHQVWGWSEYRTAGKFKSVCAISEGNADAVYAIVEREVKGRRVQYVERFDDRAFETVEDAVCVDSALSYDGPAAARLGNLWHLEGEEVVALADGNVVKNLTVWNGSVTLPNAASKVHLGLPYTCDIQTLPLDLGSLSGSGTVMGRQKRIGELTLRVQEARGVFAGPSFDKLDEWKQRSTEAYGEAIRLFTGDVSMDVPPEWNDQGIVCIRQADPLPLTLLAIAPEVDIGG
ncbi:ubiquitin-activating E1 FCCH domain-containing protein [Algihabitans sp.]|uniref:phage nozzle protein n=1 Tax=Algihabitans sp. TaxID=2821514 RepID=UPI003BA91C60